MSGTVPSATGSSKPKLLNEVRRLIAVAAEAGWSRALLVAKLEAPQ